MIPRNKICSHTGFTLIELSIVLVIIGLIVGGVLVGRDLIKASQVRAQISQFQQFTTAASTFRLKYKYLPGDIPPTNAAGFGFAVPVGITASLLGNGNNMIEDWARRVPILNVGYEPQLFFVHLSQAGLIEGQYTNDITTALCRIGVEYPRAKLTTAGIVVSTAPEGYLAWYYGANRDVTNAACSVTGLGNTTLADILTPSEAYAIDTKMDNGTPIDGKAKTVENINVYDTTSGACIVSAAANTYNVTSNAVSCRLLIGAY